MVKCLEVGINMGTSASASDIALYSEFDNMQALEDYRIHPEHVKVVEFIEKICSEGVSQTMKYNIIGAHRGVEPQPADSWSDKNHLWRFVTDYHRLLLSYDISMSYSRFLYYRV